MLADLCLVSRLAPRINPPALCVLLSSMFSFVRFPPSGHGLPACGEVKLNRGWTYLNCNCNSKEYEAELVDWKGALAGG
jgi:hypothetical protein